MFLEEFIDFPNNYCVRHFGTLSVTRSAWPPQFNISTLSSCCNPNLVAFWLVGLEKNFWRHLLSPAFWPPSSHITGTSFVIPWTSQERNLAAKFQPDRPIGLAREVERGDGQTDRQTDTQTWTDGWTDRRMDGRMVHNDNTLSGIPISDKLIFHI